jgi:hypothetical protein
MSVGGLSIGVRLDANQTEGASTMKRRILIAGMSVALAAATILAACGGGSSGSSMGTSATAMKGASGVVTGFGSVFVNGTEFATDMHTQVLDGDNDDAAASTANLQVGMTVDLDASAGSASMLRFTSAVRGEVDAVDTTMSTLTVLGQTVRISSGSSFAGHMSNGSTTTPVARLSDIHVGDYVVAFGYLECPGSSCSSGTTDIVATLVNVPASVGMYRVQGYVSNYSSSSNSFTINGLTVDIATMGMGTSATVCNTMNCAFANGDFVSVRSTSAPTGTYAATGSTLTVTASDIKVRPVAPTFAVGSTVTIEGPVTQLSGTSFVVRGISVDASGIASSTMGLVNNQIVEVTGTVSASGMLKATSIEVERSATFMLMGSLDSVSATGLSVLGQSFSVASNARFVDRASDMRPFNSTNFASVLMAGNQLVVSGYPSGTGNVATRVERIPTPASPTAGVAGVVSADNAPTDTMMTVAGISVTLNSSTQLFYFGSASMPTLSGFFSSITPNTSIALAFGAPGSTAGTITAADAAVLRANAHWEED